MLVWTKIPKSFLIFILMKLQLFTIGRTDDAQLKALITTYVQRLEHYVSFEYTELPDIKNTKKLSESLQKQQEGEVLLKQFQASDFIVLLDEKGKQFTSRAFAEQLQKRMNSGLKRLCFVIGGPYGFSDAVYERANQKISLLHYDIFPPDGAAVYCGTVVSGFFDFTERALSSRLVVFPFSTLSDSMILYLANKFSTFLMKASCGITCSSFCFNAFCMFLETSPKPSISSTMNFIISC